MLTRLNGWLDNLAILDCLLARVSAWLADMRLRAAYKRSLVALRRCIHDSRASWRRSKRDEFVVLRLLAALLMRSLEDLMRIGLTEDRHDLAVTTLLGL